MRLRVDGFRCALAALGLFGAAALGAQNPAELTGTLRIGGTDTMTALLERWAAAFEQLHPGVHIEISAAGALSAAPALAAGSDDLVALGRELTPPELARLRAAGELDPLGLRVAIGSYETSGKTVALAFFVNAKNPLQRLSFEQLDAIYCTTLRRGAAQTAERWGQLGLGGEWADRPIHAVGVNFPDGISNFIRLRVCDGGQFRDDLRTEHTGGPVNVLQRIVDDVAADPAAIGYAGFANLAPGSRAVAISEVGDAYLSGTRAEVAEARYPLTRFVYLYPERRPGEAIRPLAAAFLRFVESSEGQALVGVDGVYMALPRPLAEDAVRALDAAQSDAARAKADPALRPFVPGPPLHGHLVSVGSDTMDDLMKLWIKGFHAFQPGVSIELQSRASMSAPAALVAGAAQLTPLSRELNPAENEAFRAKRGYPPTEIAVALGSYRTPTRTVALTFYVNDANPATRLSLSQLQSMWCAEPGRESGEANTWSRAALKGDWAARPIHLVGVLPPDGVPNFISRRICGGGPLREGILGEKNGGPESVLTRIVQDVAKDPDAIGYAGFHNVQPGTHAVAIGRGPDGPFYTGTFDEVRTDVYPLTRFVYFYVDRAPGKPLQPPLAEFVRYVLSLDGQRMVEREGVFLPLPASVAEREISKVR